jgi:cytochrome c oxidase assembly protein subunit 11
MLIAFAMALGMLALGYAAVPLYNLFCRVTGFAGTTQVATEADAATAERLAASAGGKTYSIRFDANTARGMPWEFHPVQVTDTVAIGQRDMATYIARNNSDRPVTGTATFNVEPEQAGAYFSKIQCFCFTEQTLQPGQEVRMPVLYYVDPKALEDPNMDGVEQITLSYTFHEAKSQPESGS